jgi:hypothetical protein
MGRQASVSAALAIALWLAGNAPVSAATGTVGIQMTGSDVSIALPTTTFRSRIQSQRDVFRGAPSRRPRDWSSPKGTPRERSPRGLRARPGNARRAPHHAVHRRSGVSVEQWSKERFCRRSWARSVYDLQARYLPEDPNAQTGPDEDVVRKKNLYAFGWNAKAGVQLHRTSGLFVNLESGIHFIDTDRRWTPMCDVSIGVGTILPRE